MPYLEEVFCRLFSRLMSSSSLLAMSSQKRCDLGFLKGVVQDAFNGNCRQTKKYQKRQNYIPVILNHSASLRISDITSRITARSPKTINDILQNHSKQFLRRPYQKVRYTIRREDNPVGRFHIHGHDEKV